MPPTPIISSGVHDTFFDLLCATLPLAVMVDPEELLVRASSLHYSKNRIVLGMAWLIRERESKRKLT